MKRLVILIVCMVGMGLMISSCETDATVDPPTFVRKPVVVSYLSPKDSLIKVQIAYTEPYFGPYQPQTKFEKSARVSILDLTDGDSVLLKWRAQDSVYAVDTFTYKIESSHKYRLLVIMPDGKQIKSVCTVPPSMKAADWVVNSWSFKGDTNQFGEQVYRWNTNLEYKGAVNGFYYQPLFSFLEGVFFYEGKTWTDPGFSLQKQGNEPLQFIDRGTSWSMMGTGGTGMVEDLYLMAWVYDQPYQDYFRSQFSDDGNPFAEPTLLHSNLEGNALGVFCAYDFEEMLIPLK